MAGNMRSFCVLVGCILLSGIADAQRCLLSRLDRFPCRFKTTNTFAGPNEYGIYRTNIRLGGAGVPECVTRNPLRTDRMNEVILPISDLGTDNLRLIFSPAMQFNEPYANQILVNYSIKCPEGRFAFFNVTKLDLQGKCENECVDSLLVHRGQFGVTESCGNDSTTNTIQLELGEFNVTFRTSEEGRFPGFEAYIVCFDPAERDMPGCVRVEGDDAADSSDAGNVNQRRKRDLEEFHNGWRRRLKRRTGNTRHIEIDIAHGDIVTYNRSTITIIREDKVYRRIRNVLVLHTFDVESNLDVYIREASIMVDGGRGFIQFFGPGPMTVTGRHAYFQLFAIDPRGIIPTEAEGMVIGNITGALTNTLGPEDDFNITRPNPPMAQFPPEAIPRLQRKRQTEEEITRFITDDAIRDAVLFENACNPVLRTLSRVTIDIAERNDPDRLQRIREEVMATATPPTEADEVDPTLQS